MKDDSVEDIRDSKNKKTIKRDRQVLAFRVANSQQARDQKGGRDDIQGQSRPGEGDQLPGQNGPPWPHVRTQADYRKAYVTLKPGHRVDYAESI